MPSTRLTGYSRRALARMICNDIPDVKISMEEAQQLLYKAMSPAVQKAYDANPGMLQRYLPDDLDIPYSACDNPGRHLITADIDATTAAKILKPLVKKYEEACEVKDQVAARLSGCRTVEQVIKEIPEFEKYAKHLLPGTSTAVHLPATNNLIATLSKLGWPKGG